MTLSRTRPAHPHIDALPPCHPRSSFIPSRPLPLRYCLCCDNTQSPAPGPAPRARVPPPHHRLVHKRRMALTPIQEADTRDLLQHTLHHRQRTVKTAPSRTPPPPSSPSHPPVSRWTAPAPLYHPTTTASTANTRSELHWKHTSLGARLSVSITRASNDGVKRSTRTRQAVPPRTLYSTTTRSYVLRSFIITFPLLQCPHSPFPPP